MTLNFPFKCPKCGVIVVSKVDLVTKHPDCLSSILFTSGVKL